MAKYRKYAQAVPADPLPEPAAAQPHVRPGDGDLHPADAARRRRLHARLHPRRHRPADQGAPHLGARVGAEDSRRAARARRCASRRKRPTPPPRSMHWRGAGGATGAIHRLFGFKFWASSSAPRRSTPSSRRSGDGSASSSIQGYGLTETAPIVTLNHPFGTQRGIGRQADRRRRGEDRATTARSSCAARTSRRGYFNAPDETRDAFEDGWFHTGDIGELDADGQLLHPRPQEGNDRHAGRAERLSRGRRARR